VDIEHFEIIVKAMLSWSDEPKAPVKSMGRHAVAARPRDELDDDDDMVDDDFEPEEELHIKPDASAPMDGAAAEAELSESEQVD
jgi:hypothetical protein